MSEGSKSGIYPRVFGGGTQGPHPLTVNAIPDEAGSVRTVITDNDAVVIGCGTDGIPGSEPAILTLLGVSSNGFGDVGLTVTLLSNDDTGKNFSRVSPPGFVNLPQGFWETELFANLALDPDINCQVSFFVQWNQGPGTEGTFNLGEFVPTDPLDWPGNPTDLDPVTDPTITDTTVGEVASAEVQFTNPDPDADGFLIYVMPEGTTGPVQAATVAPAATPTVTATITLPEVPNPNIIFILIIIPYFIEPTQTIGPPSVPIQLQFIPIINVVMEGGIDLGGTAVTTFVGDPSGIYTLVPGKTHDTLYERLPAIESVNVKIPDPIIKTGYIGE